MDFINHLSFSAILSALVVGLVVGLLARVLKPGDDNMSLILTTLMGLLGSFLAKVVGHQLAWAPSNHWLGWGSSVVATIVLLYAYSLVFRRRRP